MTKAAEKPSRTSRASKTSDAKKSTADTVNEAQTAERRSGSGDATEVYSGKLRQLIPEGANENDYVWDARLRQWVAPD